MGGKEVGWGEVEEVGGMLTSPVDIAG